jgi:hypothetical protein
MSELLQSGLHPDADQLNAFVEQTLPPHELEQTLAHLAVCPDCRQIVALSLPPADDPLPRPVHKPWFFRWNLVWPAVAAVTAIVFIIALVRNNATTRNNAGAPTQVATSNPPAPLQPLTTPEVSNPKLLPLPNAARDKTAINTRSAGGPLLQNGLPQPASASGTQAIHGQLRPSVSNANRVGIAIAAPQKEPALPTDHFLQSPTGSSDATAANASGRLIQPPPAAPFSQPPAPAPPPPITAPNAAPANQTVEATHGVSNYALHSTNNDIQLSQARNIVTHSLPSNLPVLSMVSNAHQVLAIDTQHSLFLSDDAGNHWKAVPAQWQGRAVKVDLASSSPAKKFSAGTAAVEAPSTNFGATGGPVLTRTPATSASLTGAVTDTTGAAISNASVVVGNPTTPTARTVKTDRTGHYLIDDLIPGNYQVVAEAPGFNKQQLDVTVTTSQQNSANLTLSVGQATETVAVSAASENIDINGSTEHLPTLSVARKNKIQPSPASQSPVFEITTDTGEHWTSTDGYTWKHN